MFGGGSVPINGVVPYNGINNGDIVIRSEKVQSLLDQYRSICLSDRHSGGIVSPIYLQRVMLTSAQRDTWKKILIEIGLDNKIKEIETEIEGSSSKEVAR